MLSVLEDVEVDVIGDDRRPAGIRPPKGRADRKHGTVVLGRGWNGCGDRIFTDPVECFVALETRDVLPAIENACRAASEGLHVAGFVAYEAAPAFDPALSSGPSLLSGAPEAPLVWMAAYEEPRPWSPPVLSSDLRVDAAAFEYDEETYATALAELREHIRQGDVYQVNFTGAVPFELHGDPYHLFCRILQAHPVPYGAYVHAGERSVVSCSPELFFDRRGDAVTVRPMKGTVRRGRTTEEDEALERWLAGDEKSRAENLMIVDLLRNDLSRCCVPGSVHVPELFTTERYGTLIQMTSTVRALLQADVGTAELFTALFPCGSVTGAPKVRATEIIRRLESGPRGVYCGALGYMHRDRAVFNVAIRTAEIVAGRGRLGVGSGIVWDSDPASEYRECLLKSRFLVERPMPAVTAPSDEPRLIETMRAERGVIGLFEHHVARIARSARALSYLFDEAEFRRRVTEQLPPHGVVKVRATLARDGDIEVDVAPLEQGPGHPWQVTVAERRIDATDPYRRHKTTRRELYEEAYDRAVDEGFSEVLFLNERDEVAEGSRTNVFAVFGDRWVTPPVDSGALPGVYRRHLLETQPGADEAVLTLADLRRAGVVYICNAVRGLIPVRLPASDAAAVASRAEQTTRPA